MTTKKLISAINGQLLNNAKLGSKIKNVSCDTRKMMSGDIFFALKGINDGHDYIDDAIKKKASAIIVEKDIIVDTIIPIIKVSNTYESLMDLAKTYLEKYPVFTIAITGSVGKTTTKDLISAILSTKYNVLKSNGNQNNHIGLPLTMSKLNSKYDFLVTELGMNHQGEIKRLSKLCKPRIAVITNIGTSHIGLLGSRKNIYKAKMEITEGIDNGILIVNGDDDYLKKIKGKKNYDVYKVGQGLRNHLYPYDINCTKDNTSFKVYIDDKEYLITLQVPGRHLINNVLMAIMIGITFEIDMDKIIDVISNFNTSSGRLNVINVGDITIIDDCYNASYESIKGAIESLELYEGFKIAILADILELGKYSDSIHKKIATILKNKDIQVLLVGNATKIIHYNLEGSKHFLNNERLINYLEKQDLSNKTILIKGSRRMHLEEIRDYLINKKTTIK
jgi:UDP-N-acetylmuramoyl-tripeptide--D-alanyl-D-alanine ligase